MISILVFFYSMAFASPQTPVTFPIFLKEGFSTVLEFDETPQKVVLGDQTLFQVEKLGQSVVVKPLVPRAVTNMFVYFPKNTTRLFLLTASDEAEPLYFKKFESSPAVFLPMKKPVPQIRLAKGLHINSLDHDKKRDFLTINFIIATNSKDKIKPHWDDLKLKYKDQLIKPTRIWSERREVQRDSFVKARAIFTKPDIPSHLKSVSLLLPTQETGVLTKPLNGGRQ